ncbi:MAG TPA: transglutaminase-like domain-containing protein [Anaerolineales bacterium]|nr:transglutaminase-like domain-containing protein [Anaerolineales bacterium]
MPETPPQHWWDWTSVILLYILLQTVAARLVVTEWTEFLHLVQGFTSIGFVIGISLGYSAFPHRRARWLSFFYMLVMIPLQWTSIMSNDVSLEEKFASIFGRLLFSLSEFFSRRPVEDPLFFVTIMSFAFWALSASAAFQLARHQNYLRAALPAAIGILVIQNYDNAEAGRVWIIGFFALTALLLLGRLTFLEEQKRWKNKRVFLSPENSIDLTSGMAIAASLIILTAWMVPSSFLKIDSVRRAWNQIIKPWNDFTERFENAVSALDSPGGGTTGEFYGSQLELGLGFPLSESVMFRVEVPPLSANLKPPRFYWRGRVYDQFLDDQWTSTGTAREEFSPRFEPIPAAHTLAGSPSRFIFTTGESRFALLYAPSQPIWFSRPGTLFTSPAGAEREITSWNASPGLLPGESYQVEAVLNNPNIQQLREAGTEYPEWVTQKYLQLPDDLPQSIRDLSAVITADAETPYDKAGAITRYLRENIKYSPTIPNPPRDADPLEWILFTHREAYCVYYASAEVLMLRSLGIPARMAVGFSQGAGTSTGDGIAQIAEEIAINLYTVRRNNAHAWPEVYFPGIGWVEFEPTGNQNSLNRPLAPRDGEDTSSNPDQDLLLEDSQLETPDQPFEEAPLEPAITPQDRFLPSLYLILIILAFAALTAFLSQRYSLPSRVPVFIRSQIERSGGDAPGWIVRWERWVKLSPIEKAFESINFGLRQLGSPAPIHATPAERADTLIGLLPEVSPQVKSLLEEHQTSLYTLKQANGDQARRAALQIRVQILAARLRYFWAGSYSSKI